MVACTKAQTDVAACICGLRTKTPSNGGTFKKRLKRVFVKRFLRSNRIQLNPHHIESTDEGHTCFGNSANAFPNSISPLPPGYMYFNVFPTWKGFVIQLWHARCTTSDSSKSNTLSDEHMPPSSLIVHDTATCCFIGTAQTNILTIHGNSGEPEDQQRGASNGNSGEISSASVTGQASEEAARLAVMVRGERRRRSLELKMAKEKAQKYLESLVLKKKERDDEVTTHLFRVISHACKSYVSRFR